MCAKRRIVAIKAIGVIFLLLAALIFTRDEVSMSGNEASRFAVIQAVGEQGVCHIENTTFRTVDRVVRNHHVYSDKPLPLSWCAGVVHAGLYRLTGFNFNDNYYFLVWFYNFVLGAGVNIAIFLLLFASFRTIRRGRPEVKALLALGIAAGGWLFAYSTVFNNHTPAALALLAAAVMLRKFRRRGGGTMAGFRIGLVAGIIGALDIPAGVVLAPAIVIAVCLSSPTENRWRPAAAAAAGTLLVAFGCFALNFAAYGEWLPLYVTGDTATFALGMEQKNHWEYLFEVLFGSRGLFSYQPFLLLFPAGIVLRARRMRPGEIALLAGTFVLMVLYIVITNEYGGAAYGFRYLIVVIPLLGFYAGCWVLETPPARWKGALAAGLLLWGVVTGVVGAYAPFCIAFEGYRSPPGHFTREIRSTFCGNLLVMSYDLFPESGIVKMMINRYGQAAVWRYLYYSALHLKRFDLVTRIIRDCSPTP